MLLLALILMPGYIVQSIGRRARAHTMPGTQIEFVLGALLAGAGVQLICLPLTALAVSKGVLDESNWTTQPVTMSVWLAGWFIAEVLVAALVAFAWRQARERLRPRKERADQLSYMGHREPKRHLRVLYDAVSFDPPRAWDGMVQSLASEGGWVVAKIHDRDQPIVGRFGALSRASWSPTTPPDILLDQVWWADRYGNPVEPMDPQRKVWINAASVDYLQIIGNP